MTSEHIFKALFEGGNNSLPYLLEFRHGVKVLRYVNNNQDISFGGNLFKSTSFKYIEPKKSGDGGSLTISGVDTDLIEFVENADSSWNLSVVGVLAESGEVQQISQFKHFFGSVSYSENEEIDFELGGDDRTDMTFPPYTFDTENNPGNA